MATRSQKKSAKSVRNNDTPKKQVENSWILILKESVLDNRNFSIITLPHPSTGNLAKYCLDNEHNKVYEIMTFSEPYRSWFLGETVKSDGSLLLVTPVNPLFLVLPRLREQCSNRAIPLQDLVSEKGFDKILNFIPDLTNIADLKGASDIKAYKYNEDKTLTWLQGRITKLSNVLKEKNIHVTAGVTAATFVSSSLGNEKIDEELYIKYAFGLVCEYLQDDLVQMLEKKYNFTPDLIETIGKKRKSEVEINGINKKVKQEPNEDIPEVKNVFNEIKRQKVLTVKEKARQKAASGTKTISSFFMKK